MRRNGFSLVELMIVIGIGGILLAITVFSWTRMVVNSNLRSAAASMMSDINMYQQQASSFYGKITSGSCLYSATMQITDVPCQPCQSSTCSGTCKGPYQMAINTSSNNYTIGRWDPNTCAYDIVATKSFTTFGTGSIYIASTNAVNSVVTFTLRGMVDSSSFPTSPPPPPILITLQNNRTSQATITIPIMGKSTASFAMK